MEEGARKLHASLERAQLAVESMPKESFEDRMARSRAYLDALHTTAREMGLDWVLSSRSMTTEEKLLAEIAHYDRVIEQVELGALGTRPTVNEALTSWEQGVAALTQEQAEQE